MVASDTIVGIVGAVLLVGVMAGVFIYEYNNVDDSVVSGGETGGEDGAMMASFADAYPSLNASEDLDGDGTANYMDDDIDGDGESNENDTATATTSSASGSIGAQAGPVQNTFSMEYFAGTGATESAVTFTLTSNVPDPFGSITVSVAAPDGSVAGSATFPQGAGAGASVTVTFAPDQVGVHTASMTQRPGGLGVSVEVEAVTAY